MPAIVRNLDALLVGRLDDGLPRLEGDRFSVQLEARHLAAPCPSFSTRTLSPQTLTPKTLTPPRRVAAHSNPSPATGEGRKRESQAWIPPPLPSGERGRG